MLAVKPGVEFFCEASAMAALLLVVTLTFEDFGYDATITSGKEGQHKVGSAHYYGRALDFRTRHCSSYHIPLIAEKIRSSLGVHFDVVEHSTHIHVEWDPKHEPNQE